MAQLRQGYEEFVRRDTKIIVVGPEGKKAFSRFWNMHDLPFTGLPDPRHTVLKRFGQEVNLFKLGRMPAQVLVDKEGVVRFAHYGHRMSDIPPNQEILELLDGIVEGGPQGVG
jgi:peroxiredoxin Q/BCP